MPPRAPRPRRGPLGLLLAVVAWTVLRVVYAGWIELSEDEAYYWVWSERLAWGYYDHPPAVAGLIRLGTVLLGKSEAGVRLVPVVLASFAALLAGTAVAPTGPGGAPLPPAARQEAQERTVLALLSLPLFGLGGLLATPDTPLALCWVAGTVAALRGRWALVGLAAGGAMLSKYTGVLLLPLLVLGRPAALRGRGPYLAAAIALVIYLPNLLWNLDHDLISLRFQLEHVAQEPDRLAFIGAQLGLAGMLAPAVLAWVAVGWRGSPDERLLWWSSVPLLGVAVWAGGEANWAAPAYLGILMGLGQRGGRWARAVWGGIGVNALLIAVVMAHFLSPLVDLPRDPRTRLAGGKTLGMAVESHQVPAVYTSRYQEAALIHFYGGVPAHALPELGRADQYDLWPIQLADDALFVRPWRGSARVATDALGYTRDSPGIVQAAVHTTDPLGARDAGAWQIYPIHRPPSATPGAPP